MITNGGHTIGIAVIDNAAGDVQTANVGVGVITVGAQVTIGHFDSAGASDVVIDIIHLNVKGAGRQYGQQQG